jgi:hypothetical protein
MIIFPTTDGRKFYLKVSLFLIGRTYVSIKSIKKSQKTISLAQKSKLLSLQRKDFLYLFVTQSDQNGRFALSFVTL